jgi:hypothetical protein
MDEVIIKDLSELPDFRKMDRRESGMPVNWGFCRGGIGLDDDQWAINHVADDFTETRYPLPHAVTVLRQWAINNATKDAKTAMRNALGL